MAGDHDDDREHDDAKEGVDDHKVDEGKDVEGLVTPPVGVAEGGLEGGPVDPQDPQVAQDEPDDEEGGEEEVGDPGPCGGGESVLGGARRPVAGVKTLVPSRLDLPPQHPQHLDGAEAAPHDHVDWDVWLLGTVSHELDTWKRQ